VSHTKTFDPTRERVIPSVYERVARTDEGQLIIEQLPVYIPSEDEERRALASISKAYPYLVEHAPHIDGEFDNAVSEIRRMFAAFRRALSVDAAREI
jgi:hypothetical protein